MLITGKKTAWSESTHGTGEAYGRGTRSSCAGCHSGGVIEKVVVGYHPVVGIYPAAQASALWNYILIAIEDASLGAHNMPYTRASLDASIVALQ